MTEQSNALGTPVDLVLGLVERLRRWPDLPGMNLDRDLMCEAADEIDRLRAAFRLLLNASDSDMEDGDLARRIARETLGPNAQ